MLFGIFYHNSDCTGARMPNCNSTFFCRFVRYFCYVLNFDSVWTEFKQILHNVYESHQLSCGRALTHTNTFSCGTAMCALNRYIIMHNWAKDGFSGVFFSSVALFVRDPDALSSPCSMHTFFVAFHFRLLFKPVNCQLFHWSPNHSICKAFLAHIGAAVVAALFIGLA